MKRIVVFALVLNAALLGVIAHQLVAIAGGGAVPTADRNGDVNGDARLDMSDAIYLLLHIFRGGPGPVALADSPEVLERLGALEAGLAELQADHWTPNLAGYNFNDGQMDLVRLPGVDLQRASLQRVSLRSADLRGANLSDARIGVADRNAPRSRLEGVNLQNAIMQNTHLYYVHMALANLEQADLRGALIQDGYLNRAVLTGADLRDARLFNCYLGGADLTDADLRGANVSGADFRGAIGVNLDGTVGTPAHMP